MTTVVSSAPFRLYPKRGDADCTIAAMATIFRRDYEDVLLAAAQVSKHVWRSGLHCPDVLRVARRLKIKARWCRTFDSEAETGMLWVSYHDSAKEHCVVLINGLVVDPDHNPVSLWDVDDYMRAQNAFANQLLIVEE